MTDPKEREPFNQVYFHTWTIAHFGRLMKEFALSVDREPRIPAGAPLDFVPKAAPKRKEQEQPPDAQGATTRLSIDLVSM